MPLQCGGNQSCVAFTFLCVFPKSETLCTVCSEVAVATGWNGRTMWHHHLGQSTRLGAHVSFLTSFNQRRQKPDGRSFLTDVLLIFIPNWRRQRGDSS